MRPGTLVLLVVMGAILVGAIGASPQLAAARDWGQGYYCWQNGQWWYWMPEGRWVYWRDNQWNDYPPSGYAVPGSAQRTFATQNGFGQPYTTGYGSYEAAGVSPGPATGTEEIGPYFGRVIPREVSGSEFRSGEGPGPWTGSRNEPTMGDY